MDAGSCIISCSEPTTTRGEEISLVASHAWSLDPSSTQFPGEEEPPEKQESSLAPLPEKKHPRHLDISTQSTQSSLGHDSDGGSPGKKGYEKNVVEQRKILSVGTFLQRQTTQGPFGGPSTPIQRYAPWGSEEGSYGVSEGSVEDHNSIMLPTKLHKAFDPSTEMQQSEPTRMKMVAELQEASRNFGKVNLMWDSKDKSYVATKVMPNNWIKSSHAEFTRSHPDDAEKPWKDIGTTRFLNSVGFPYAVNLLGVYQGEENTEVVTSYANEGDLFQWSCATDIPEPGPVREAMVRPVAIQLLKAVQLLHKLSIVHCDISMENVLVSKTSEDVASQLQIVDFAMCSSQRHMNTSNIGGKKSYQAPEIHGEGVVDGFLIDVFSVGVVLYCILVNDYPWMSTKPGKDKPFEYMKRCGFRKYVEKQRIQKSKKPISSILSESAVVLLEGLLHPDPSKRLTLGEDAEWLDEEGDPRRSVWNEDWLRNCAI